MDNTIADSLHPLERKVLPVLGRESSFKGIVKASGLADVEVMRAIQWLSNKKLVTLKEEKRQAVHLDANGIAYLKDGLPEKRFLSLVKDNPATLADLRRSKAIDGSEINICIGILRSKAAIAMSGGKISITDAGKKMLGKESLEENFLKRKFPVFLDELDDQERFALDVLRKRKRIVLVQEQKSITAELTDIGKRLSNLKLSDQYIDRLTSSHLKSGRWKGAAFRRYDVSANVSSVHGGKRHFVNQAIDYVKQVWLELGFTEMSGPYVQTSFWDLDSLYVPQDHPARQMQDTFYIRDPKRGKLPSFWKRVKEAHENGAGTGSTGWKGKWSEDIAKELLLITHDTYLSAKVLSSIKKEDLPVKTFQIMKVFRNEALDWKHLFEFYQVGGIVVDMDLNFRHLLGYLKLFFKKMGYDDVRIRPGHFPYVEPGAEIEVFHPVHKQWIELGGSGIFRPEVTKPLLGFECPVLAWGFGLDRIISEYWNINDIRDLYKNDLKQMRELKVWMR